MATSTAAMRMREAFGDRKPEISRKIKACVACRKLKIKCQMPDAGSPCRRCKTRGLSCTINKSLQMLLEGDAVWKERTEARINELERLSHNGASCNESVRHDQPEAVMPQEPTRGAVQVSPQASGTPMAIPESTTTLNLSCSLGAFPGTSMTSPAIRADRQIDAHMADPILRQVVTLDAAERHFTYYKQQLDHFMHYDLRKSLTMASVRSRSPFLLTAICTVAAFCSGSPDYQACLELYRSEVTRKLFSHHYDFDDVRALCIGALWLSDISATLNGLAVRISTQLDLHRCLTKMPHTKKECYERTRLYFLVYLVDHHCSLVYGRPPMTREWKSLKDPRAFLQSPHSRATDLSLISQVELWATSRRVFEQFGADVECFAVSRRTADMLQLGEAYGEWQVSWRSTMSVATQAGALSESERVFDLYYHSAKLHLYSHAYRGPDHGAGPLAEVRASNPLAEYVLDSAIALLQRALNERDDGTPLFRLPAYFATMIAYASVCLIRAGVNAQETDDTRRKQSQDLITRLAFVLRAASFSNTHPLSAIAKGLEAATFARPLAVDNPSPRQNEAGFDDPMMLDFDAFANDDFDWGVFASDDYWALCGSGNGAASTPSV